MVGDYRVLKKLGEGGMGVVHLAVHRALGQQVVLKGLHAHLTSDKALQTRLAREAEAMARLRHPNIVSIYNFIATPEGAFIVMEYVEGVTFDDLIMKFGSVLPDQAVQLMIPVLKAVEFAHRQGVIHRDLKPVNIMLGFDEKVRVLDFGTAKLVDQPGITRSGTTLGTANYMAPEHLMGMDLAPAADIYALGATLYEMVTGCLPYEAQSTQDLVRAVFTEAPTPPSVHVPEIPLKLEEVILRCLAKKQDQRYPSAKELCQALEAVLATLAPSTPLQLGGEATADAGTVAALKAAPASLGEPEPAAATATVPPKERGATVPISTAQAQAEAAAAAAGKAASEAHAAAYRAAAVTEGGPMAHMGGLITSMVAAGAGGVAVLGGVGIAEAGFLQPGMAAAGIGALVWSLGTGLLARKALSAVHDVTRLASEASKAAGEAAKAGAEAASAKAAAAASEARAQAASAELEQARASVRPGSVTARNMPAVRGGTPMGSAELQVGTASGVFSRIGSGGQAAQRLAGRATEWRYRPVDGATLAAAGSAAAMSVVRPPSGVHAAASGALPPSARSSGGDRPAPGMGMATPLPPSMRSSGGDRPAPGAPQQAQQQQQQYPQMQPPPAMRASGGDRPAPGGGMPSPVPQAMRASAGDRMAPGAPAFAPPPPPPLPPRTSGDRPAPGA